MNKNEICNWFRQAVDNQDCLVELEGYNEKGNGYVGDILFAKVTIKDSSREEKVTHLVAKISKSDSIVREIFIELYKTELNFYNKVVPILYKLLEVKNVQNPLRAIAKCYKTITLDDREVIILENLKQQGYEIHPKKTPMNINHIKFALRNYAKFHALSFAIHEQEKDLYSQIEEVHNKLPINYYRKEIVAKIFNSATLHAMKILKENGKEELLCKYKELMQDGPINAAMNVLEDPPLRKVVVHGDCHNGNHLIKYKDGNKDFPLDMVFVDFQLSTLHSPMIDISLFLYAIASQKELEHFKELINFYHMELSSFLHELGSDAKTLYPESTMWQEWKKYSTYGVIIVTSLMRVLFAEDELAPEISEPEKFIDMNGYDKSVHQSRLLTVLEHYFTHCI